MEDPSIKKRLIDFGIDEHEYDEVQDLPDESNNPQSQQQQTNTQLLCSPTSSSNFPIAANLPPELPPPKQQQKTIKNSKKSKNKSKIPRSPSLAVNSQSSGGSGSGGSSSNTPTHHYPATSQLPPQTPPLPVNYKGAKQHLNGGGVGHKNNNKNNNNSISTPALNNNGNIGYAGGMGGGVQLNNQNNNNNNNSSGMVSPGANGGGGGSGVGGGGINQRGNMNMTSSARRPQIQIPPLAESPKNFQFLTLTVRKDENGYGMKVSGDNPVFVESVKPGGAAQIAGLVAGDMILKVNGQEVRSEKHPTVVNLIKASTIVELAVKRNHKTVRPASVGIVPSTPILGRDRTASITGPQPVDSIKRREMETYKIQTLQKMLEQEKLNLEQLKGDTDNPSYKLSEANIRRLREQLRQVGAEDAPAPVKLQPTANNMNNKNMALLSPSQIHHLQHQHHLQPPASTPQPQPPQQSSPAFLSLLPRSLSSLSLGTRRNKTDKELITSPLNNTTDFLHHHHLQQQLHHHHQQQQHNNHGNNNNNALSPLPPYTMSQSLHQASTPTQQQQQRHSLQQLFHHQPPPPSSSSSQRQSLLQSRSKDNTPKSSSSNASNAKSKNKYAKNQSVIQEDIPPPLPQRNPPRQLQLDNANNNNNGTQLFAPVSDLDQTPQRKSPLPIATVIQPAAESATAVSSSGAAAQKKRANKSQKTKALSDPKMSTQLFLQMETVATEHGTAGGGMSEIDSTPPPLPPRQPGMLEEGAGAAHKGSFPNLTRPPPNSIETMLAYPLVATCTPVHRDDMAAAFPLSQRPNIVQQLQQHQQMQQQQQGNSGGGGGVGGGQGATTAAALGQTPANMSHMSKHRRVVSSPDNMHQRHPDRLNKTTSGSWELVEKDGEITPPGTPPPPYLTMASPDDHHNPHEPGIFIESHHFTPLASATSPPPQATAAASSTSTSHSNRIQVAQSSATQKEIISMEDEDSSDQEEPFIDENGPFNNLHRLLEPENVVFLAVFLNYVLSNSEPSPLLFYLITGLYKEGTAKDMRKWAYEIHSTFLVPFAPLSWYRKDESLAREVDNVLQSEFDKVEILRKVFWKSRKCARDTICEQLRIFQQTRTEGLGTIYGPTDAQLIEARGDKQREQHIFDETLMRKLKALIEEYEKDMPVEDPKKLALCSALSTVIHRIFITRSHPNSIIDRVHHFVSREKSFKSRIMGKNRKLTVRGHQLVLHQYYEVTHCNHCQTIIWGVSPQGYHCTDCKLNIHRPCSKVLDESCPGPLPQAKRKEPHNDNKISKFMGKIRPRTSSDFIAMEKRARHEDDLDTTEFGNERLHASSSIVRQPSDRRPDASSNQASRSNGNATDAHTDDVLRLQSTAAGYNATSSVDASGTAKGAVAMAEANAVAAAAAAAEAQDAVEGKDARRERLHQHHQNKSAPVSVNRSESYKERLSHKRNRNSRRKTSDPSLTSRPNDDHPDVGLGNSNYTASSNSSLSSGGGSESPSTSMEQMGAATNMATSAHHHHTSSLHGPHTPAHHLHHHQHQDSFHGSTGGGSMNNSFWGGSTGSGATQLARQWNFESDDDDDLNETDWSSNVAAEVLAVLTDAEKKRQEIINEIYQTERSHVRTLKLLERLFLVPLQESGVLSDDHLMLLFPPALLSLRELHSSFEQKLKQRRLEHNHLVTEIGDLLACMFDGQPGDELCDYAAQFCARQQIALEALKEKRRKDEQLQKLLSKAESHKACRRLQLKDLLPAVLQRLTKYPLLFDNLYKVTTRVVPENTTEAQAIQRALESSKKILCDVNQAVKIAEDKHKLQNIQRKLDKSTFDKEEFKNLDLTQYRLIHDGSLTMKKNPSIQLHGLLFDDMIVLLTKQDDKYALKYLHAARNTEVNNKPVSPIMSIDAETLVRQEAADKNSFFLIKTKTSQMLELRAPSSSECKTWFKHISDAAEQYKPRSKNANHEPVDDPAIATLPHSNTKESLELTPERPPPMAATATVTTTPLAPLMPVATATSVHPHGGNNNMNNNNNNNYENILRNGRRESTPTAGGADNGAYHRQRLSHNELSPAMSAASSASSVNRTMSTRSCGEANNNGAFGPDGANANGVTLRHTQSARQANGGPNSAAADEQQAGAGLAGGWKRDSASIVYSNNSNNTRTLMQSSPPLVEPTAIQISISPAHTAEPVLTPGERLRRLDAAIRDGLLEKQKIICDMFRLPVEHFHEIVDIAAMPEAPKDSADIALAAYAQVQSLTEVLNDYMHVTSEQEISAVSTAVCDQCHEKQQHRHQRPVTPGAINSSPTSTASASSTATQIAAAASDTPPPLPPPNKQHSSGGHQQAQQQTPTPTNVRTVLQNAVMDEVADIHEDDDGYCEIDELRLPALPATLTAATGKTTKTDAPPPLPPPAGTFKVPPPPPPHNTNTVASTTPTTPTTEQASTTPTTAGPTPELVKRQSTISADSIPEESADEVSKALSEGMPEAEKAKEEEKVKETEESTDDKKEETEASSTEIQTVEDDSDDTLKAEKEKNENEQESSSSEVTQAINKELINEIEKKNNEEDKSEGTEEVEKSKAAEATKTEEEIAESTDNAETKEDKGEEAAELSFGEDSPGAEEQIDIADAFNALSTLNAKLNNALARVDTSTQTMPMPMALALYAAGAANANSEALLKATQQHNNPGHCGPNRIQHANSLEPSIPCYALNSIVSALNAQISLLLPKISERDMERERLRKENQHLRELLNAMHERQRVEAKLETPTDGTQPLSSDDSAPSNLDETDGANTSSNSNSNSDTTLTALTVTNDSDSTPSANASEAPKETV